MAGGREERRKELQERRKVSDDCFTQYGGKEGEGEGKEG